MEHRWSSFFLGGYCRSVTGDALGPFSFDMGDTLKVNFLPYMHSLTVQLHAPTRLMRLSLQFALASPLLGDM